MNMKQYIPLSDKYALTLSEASAYFGIGVKKLKRLADENGSRFFLYNGNRCMIIRVKMEQFLEQTSSI